MSLLELDVSPVVSVLVPVSVPVLVSVLVPVSESESESESVPVPVSESVPVLVLVPVLGSGPVLLVPVVGSTLWVVLSIVVLLVDVDPLAESETLDPLSLLVGSELVVDDVVSPVLPVVPVAPAVSPEFEPHAAAIHTRAATHP
ncbi:MAG TPA: hypothetical protein VIK91_12580 [Nannocystis sp.]